MIRAITFFLLLVLIYSCKGQNKQNLSAANPNRTSLDSFINYKADSFFQKEKVPGIFVAVLKKGERKYYSFGYADPDREMIFDSATIFEAGSITKTFTAYVLQSVLRDKKISDTSSIISYLPDSVQQNNALAKISFLSLVNHTSGLPRLPGNMDILSQTMAPYDNYTADKLFAYLKTAEPKPDGRSNYSNLGAGLAGVLAERISGKPYESLLEEYIFRPFNVKATVKPVTDNSHKSQGYFENRKSSFWNMSVLAPAGGLKCDAAALLTYLQCMSLPVNDESKKITDLLLQPTALLSTKVRIGRGWHTIEDDNSPVIYWHNGGTYGFSTFAAFAKNQNKAVVVVVNQFNKNTISDVLGVQIMRQLLK